MRTQKVWPMRRPPRRFGGQNYAELRKKPGNLLFVDQQFPPTNSSLFLEEHTRTSDIVWKRPGELCSNPQLFVEGAEPNDVTQGILGNCWFVSACSALTHNQQLLQQVIPDAEKQEWAPGNIYAGIFRFRFWRFGEWVEVVIDDLLPTRDGKLLFARSKTPNEFWSALLEKAFAKLYGCYENLVGGHLSEGLSDISGGVTEAINVKKYLNVDTTTDRSSTLFTMLKSAFDNQALIVAAIAAKVKEEIEQSLSCGLVKGHAYAVTAMHVLDLPQASTLSRLIGTAKEQQRLIRLQNPWGEKEWNGAWSDGSAEWEQVNEAQKKALGITIDEDGEFWMPWESFVAYFTDISLCQMFNTAAFSLSKRYHENLFFDKWTTNGAKSGAPQDLAGGCPNFPATFCNNPQYAFDIESDTSEVMLSLTQRENNEGQKRREPYITIGMHVMKVENNRKHRVHQPTHPVSTSEYANSRSVFLHLTDLPRGRYILLPTTFAPREETDFLLRFYSDVDVRPRTLTQHAPRSGLCGCKSATNVTRIEIVSVTLGQAKDVNCYFILSCNKLKYRTQTNSSTLRDWNEQFVFHRSKNRQSYRIQLYEDRKFARDTLIGSTEVLALIDNDTREVSLQLTQSSTVQLRISAFDDPMYL